MMRWGKGAGLNIQGNYKLHKLCSLTFEADESCKLVSRYNPHERQHEFKPMSVSLTLPLIVKVNMGELQN